MYFLRRTHYISNSLFVRTYKKRPSSSINPGLNKRLSIINEEQHNIRSSGIDEDAIEHFEHDVYNSKSMLDLHKRELNNIQKKIRFKQIEIKYFKRQKLPTMLLWAEKEQIRLLSQSDPDLWTPQKLAECFPATVDIIIKLLRSQWKPASEERIKSHDNSVSANWRAFEKGTLRFPEYIASHLKSFTSREKIILKPDKNLPEIPERKGGEFSDIIRHYKDTEILSERKEPIPNMKSGKNDTFILGKKSNSRFKTKECTLEAMKSTIQNSELSDSLSHSLMNETTEKTIKVKGILNENISNKLKEQDITTIEIENVLTHATNRFVDDILMKIQIPREKWKKGCIYKVNNCYYSDDGEFLYRV